MSGLKCKSIVILVILVFLINFGLIGLSADHRTTSPPPIGSSRDVTGNDGYSNAEPISPGSHQGSVDAASDPIDMYKIHLNGSVGLTDIINISVNTTSIGWGFVILWHPDYMDMGIDFVTDQGNGTIDQVITTTATHYIMIYAYAGQYNYWLNFTVTQTTNPKNDMNNDFGNATTAIKGDQLSQSVNETWDYYDVYKINVPKDMNITITADPSADLALDLRLYDAPNSSSDHLISEDSEFTGDRVAVYNDTTLQAGWYYVYVICEKWAGPKSMYGNYLINFSYREPNCPPCINVLDPMYTVWCTSTGLTIKEDVPAKYIIDLTQHFIDDGKPTPPAGCSYKFECNNTNISVSIFTNKTVTFTPAENWFGGPIPVTFYANDSVFECCDTLNVTVSPVNDAPVLHSALTWDISNASKKSDTELQMVQGKNVSILMKAHDDDQVNPDPDELFYDLDLEDCGNTNLTFLPDKLYLDEDTGIINYIPVNDDVGTFLVSARVRDRSSKYDPGVETDSRTISFTVTNKNDNPILSKISTDLNIYQVDSLAMNFSESAKQGEEFEFSVEAIDPDFSTPGGDSLVFSTSTPKFTISPTTIVNKVIVKVNPTNADAMKGLIEGQISVKDIGLMEDWVVLTLPIENANDAPEFTYVGGHMIFENKLIQYTGSDSIFPGDYLNFTLQATDIDELDVLTFTTDNTTFLTGMNPELVIIQDPVNRSAKVSFHPKEEMGDSTVFLKFIVTDDGTPDFDDWVMVEVRVVSKYMPGKEYTLTQEDCDKSYTDVDNDVVTYERDSDGNIVGSRGGHSGLDIISVESRKFNEDIIITVKCARNIEDLSYLKWLDVYIVRSKFDENGSHLKPSEVDRSVWDGLPFQPDSGDIYSSLLTDRFSAYNILGDYFKLDYDSVINGNTWTVTMQLEKFENTFGVSHDTGFEIFAISFDGSQLNTGDLTNIFGPKSYDSAGYNAATAPDVSSLQAGSGSSKDDLLGFDMILIILVIIIVIVVIIAIAFVATRKKKVQAAPVIDSEAPVEVQPAAQPLVPLSVVDEGPVPVTCLNCGWVIRNGSPICVSCGAPAPPPPPPGQPCMYCQVIIPPGAFHCPGCGSRGPDAPPPTTAAQEPAPPSAEQLYGAPQAQPPPEPQPQPTTYGQQSVQPPPQPVQAPMPDPAPTPAPIPPPTPAPAPTPTPAPQIKPKIKEEIPSSPYEDAGIKEIKNDGDKPIIMDREAEELDE